MKKELDLSGFDEEVQKESNELDLSGFDEEVAQEYEEEQVPETSQAMAGLVGIGQGATLGLGDEIGSAALALLSKGADFLTGPSQEELINQQLKAKGFTGSALDTKDESLKELYQRYRDTTRGYQDKLKEEHGGTYFGGELAGGLASTGIGAVGNLARGTSTAAKALRGAAQGAIQGGIAGAGYSEADLTEGKVGDFAKDTIVGTAIGGAMGGGIPAVGAVAKRGVDLTKTQLGKLGAMAPSLTSPFKFAKKHGLKSYDEVQDIYQKQVTELVDQMTGKLKSLGANKEELAQELTEGLDLTKGLSELEKRFRTKARMLPKTEKEKALKFADEVSEMIIGPEEYAKNQLIKEANQEIQKQVDASSRRVAATPAKTESKIAKELAKTGEELEMVAQKQMSFDDLAEGMLDTPQGAIDRTRVKLSKEVLDESGQPIKQVREKIYADDVTPFQATEPVASMIGNTPVVEYMNKATNEIFRKYGKEVPAGIDFRNMSLDDLHDFILSTGKLAYQEGGSNQELNQELWKVARNYLNEIMPQLSKSKADQSKVYEMASILNMDKEVLSGRVGKEALADLMETLRSTSEARKSFVKRNFLDKSNPMQQQLDAIDLTNDFSKVLEKRRDFSITGGISTIGSLAAEAAGAGTRAISRATGVLTSPVSKIANGVSRMTDDQLAKSVNAMINSNNAGRQAFGKQLQFALQQEGPIKNAAIWSLSQQPAFREAVRQSLNDSEGDITELLGTERLPASEFDEPMPVEDNVSLQDSENKDIRRSPQGKSDELIDTTKMREWEGFKTKGYVPNQNGSVIGNSGVTVANGLDLGQRNNLDDLNLPEDIKEKLTPYLGIKKEAALNMIQRNPLVLSQEEASIIANSVDEAYYKQAESKFNKNKYGKKFSDLPKEVRTVLNSVNFHTGNIGPKTIEKAANDDDYSDLIDELDNYYSNPEIQNSFQGQRRKKEADYLRESLQIKRKPQSVQESAPVSIEQLQDLQKRLNAHSKYVNSGGSAVYSATGERLMESVNQLDIPEEVKQEAQDAIVDGDIQKLRQMLVSLKGAL